MLKVKHLKVIETPKIGPVVKTHHILPGPNFSWKDIKQMTFSGLAACEMDLEPAEASNPDANASVAFIAGKGFTKLGYRTGCEFYLVDNRLYRRLTWVDMGVRGKQAGFKTHQDKCLVYYVVEIEFTDDLKEAIGEEL